MSGDVIVDVGFKGDNRNAVPIFPHAIGVDLDFPGYDGIHLPFEDNYVDAVFASHVLEHVSNAKPVLRDWFRALKIGGFLVCIVPHQYLYERKWKLPSQWSLEHQHFYTPSSLLAEFEASLAPNSYRLRHLSDNDLGYIYERLLNEHPGMCYEIEAVIEKMQPPSWSLE
jgi:SAM-dependent methyltransferase